MGRTPTGRAPIQSIKLVRGKHLEIIRRLIAGEPQRKIALDLGISEGRLSVICNSPLFKRKHKELEDEVRARFIEKTASVASEIDEMQPKAVNVLKSLLNDEKVNGVKVSPALKRDVALDFLDLGGNGKKSKEVENSKNAMDDVVKIISQGFELAKSAIEERRYRNEVVDPGGIVVEITPEDLQLRENVSLIPENIDNTDDVDKAVNT
jgi:hypothetical protein